MLKELVYPWVKPPEPGAVIELAPQVHERTQSALLWLRMGLPFALDHINVWMMRHGPGWCLVDCGYGNDATRALWEEHFTETMDGLPITQLVATHYHPDHLGNARWLMDRFQAPLMMSYAEFVTAHAIVTEMGPYSKSAAATFYRSHGVSEAMLEQLSKRRGAYSIGVPTLPEHIVGIRPGQTLSLGGHDWRCIGGYGHCPEHIALYCEALRVLISGDMLLPKISTNVNVWPIDPEFDAVGAFLDSLDEFADLPDDTLVLPSHGLPFRGVRVRVAALHQHHRERMEQLVAALDAPKTAIEVLPVLFRRDLDMHQTFFAIGEVIAHLNHGVATQRLRRLHGSDGLIRFQRL